MQSATKVANAARTLGKGCEVLFMVVKERGRATAAAVAGAAGLRRLLLVILQCVLNLCI
jgi:hypothetical protein